MNADEKPTELAMLRLSFNLPGFAKALDKELQRKCGERIGFALIAFKFGDPAVHGQRAQYVSNCDRETMTKALEETLERWKAGHIRPPPGSGAPEKN